MPNLPRAILLDLDDTILSAFGAAQGQWERVIATYAEHLAPHAPATHISRPTHARPHAPQSDVVSSGVHAPSHTPWPAGHAHELSTHRLPGSEQSPSPAHPSRHSSETHTRPEPPQSAWARQPSWQRSPTQIRPAPHASSSRHPSKQLRSSVLQMLPLGH